MSNPSKESCLLSTQTKTDPGLDAAKDLFETASHLENSLCLVERYLKILEDPDSSKSSILQVTRCIKMSVTPLLCCAIELINNTGKCLSPLPAVKNLHNKYDKRRFHDAVDMNNTKIPPEKQMVDKFLISHKTNAVPTQMQTRKKRKAAIPSKMPKPDSNLPFIPPPKNGVEHGPREIVGSLSSIANGLECGKNVSRLIHENLVPCSQRTIYNKLKDHKKIYPFLMSGTILVAHH